MGKSYYSWAIGKDPQMKGTAVRCTTIPEELGRISYLLTDKTGTLTQNSMVLKRLHLGTVSYAADSFNDVSFVNLITFKSKYKLVWFVGNVSTKKLVRHFRKQFVDCARKVSSVRTYEDKGRSPGFGPLPQRYPGLRVQRKQ